MLQASFLLLASETTLAKTHRKQRYNQRKGEKQKKDGASAIRLKTIFLFFPFSLPWFRNEIMCGSSEESIVKQRLEMLNTSSVPDTSSFWLSHMFRMCFCNPDARKVDDEQKAEKEMDWWWKEKDVEEKKEKPKNWKRHVVSPTISVHCFSHVRTVQHVCSRRTRGTGMLQARETVCVWLFLGIGVNMLNNWSLAQSSQVFWDEGFKVSYRCLPILVWVPLCRFQSRRTRRER